MRDSGGSMESAMRSSLRVAVLASLLAVGPAVAAESPVGVWKTVDDRSGKVRSEVQIYKVYKAEIWVEGGTLKVRGYVGFLYKTQTWLKGP
jgi:uncharacterized protein (DUF2147 family)